MTRCGVNHFMHRDIFDLAGIRFIYRVYSNIACIQIFTEAILAADESNVKV
jgi:hypothetical protein